MLHSESDETLLWHVTAKYVCFCAGVNVKTGDMFPSSFTYKGPAEELRSARTFTGGQVLQDILLFGAKEIKKIFTI